MTEIVREAIVAGALGFSTSRTIVHTAIDGEPVPGTFAAEDELFGIGSALGDLGTGIFELAPMGAAGEDIVGPAKEVDWMRRLSAKIGRPVTFALIQVDSAPELWRELMDASLAAVEDGADIWPQVAGRATGLLSGHHTTYSLFDAFPAYQELKARASPTRSCSPSSSVPRCARRSSTGSPTRPPRAAWPARTTAPSCWATRPTTSRAEERSLAGMAAASGRHPLEVAYDAMLADERPGPAVRPDPELRPGQPGTGARDVPAPPRSGRARRRRCALRRDLRRVDADVHADALDPRPQPRRPTAARGGGPQADP